MLKHKLHKMVNSKKYALITGATSGIGYELARLFAENQYNLLLIARDQTELDHKANEILNLASIASKAPGPWQSVYHGTKAFVLSFTEAIREELKDQGITVTALLPGATETDFFNKADMNESKIVQDGDLDDPVKVAKDGFEALMAGKDKVISGMKNKIKVGMTNVISDSAAAHQMAEQQKPKNKE